MKFSEIFEHPRQRYVLCTIHFQPQASHHASTVAGTVVQFTRPASVSEFFPPLATPLTSSLTFTCLVSIASSTGLREEQRCCVSWMTDGGGLSGMRSMCVCVCVCACVLVLNGPWKLVVVCLCGSLSIKCGSAVRSTMEVR